MNTLQNQSKNKSNSIYYSTDINIIHCIVLWKSILENENKTKQKQWTKTPYSVAYKRKKNATQLYIIITIEIYKNLVKKKISLKKYVTLIDIYSWQKNKYKWTENFEKTKKQKYL